MLLLSMDQSAARGSAALLRDGELLSDAAWTSSWNDNQGLFAGVSSMLREAGVMPGEIEVFAVGVGPGSFSGNRIALAAARAFALPGGKPVFGISSGEAIACEVLDETGRDAAVVVGDARRSRFWHGLFGPGRPLPARCAAWALASAGELRAAIPGGAVVASPDWDRLSCSLPGLVPADALLVDEPRFPSAARLGVLAFHKMLRGIPSEPLAPIYLHPAVQPRDPA